MCGSSCGSRLRTSGVSPPCRGLTGIVTGDSIIAVEGRPVNKAADLSNILDDFKIGVPRRHVCRHLRAATSHMQPHAAAQPALAAAQRMWPGTSLQWVDWLRRGQSHPAGAAWRRQSGGFNLGVHLRECDCGMCYRQPVPSDTGLSGAVCCCSRRCRRCNFSWRHKLAARHEESHVREGHL